jgi:hypothetical protein
MKLGRSIAAHAILAIGGLSLAYWVWAHEDVEVGENEVTILECSVDTITRVELTSREKDVTLELSRDERGLVSWFTVTRRPEQGEPSSERFVGAASVREWLQQIAPLRARRSLGELTAEQLGEVELDEPEGRLAVRCGDRTTTFQLGGRAYGTGDRYVRGEGGGPVYLVATDRLAPLESAEHRLMERALHTFEWRDVLSLRLRAFEQEKTLQQHNRLDEQRSEWVDAASPDRRDETYGNWLSRFPRLRVQRYLDPEARPGADLEGLSAPSARVMRIDFTGERGGLGFVELERVDGAEAAYYARTETTRSWVRVPTSLAQQIEDDLRSMLGVAPLERPTPATGTPTPSADAGAPVDAGVPPGAANAPSSPTPSQNPRENNPPSGATPDDDGARRNAPNAAP